MHGFSSHGRPDLAAICRTCRGLNSHQGSQSQRVVSLRQSENSLPLKSLCLPLTVVILLQITTNQENSLSQQQVLALEQHCRERIHALEAQIEALEQTRVADQIASEQGMVSGVSVSTCRSTVSLPLSRMVPLQAGEPLERAVHLSHKYLNCLGDWK